MLCALETACRWVLVVPILMVCQSVYAQSFDKVMYRITYKTRFVKDTLERDSNSNYRYLDDEMRLDIGRKCNAFYSSREKQLYDYWAEAMKRGGEASPDMQRPAYVNLTLKSFRNYPEGSNTWMISSGLYGSYRFEEPMSEPQWSLCADTCTILGYSCSKAETYYKGRHWTAWYTDEIPIGQGPWFLSGLPGLILKAEDARLQWVFTAVGLEQMKGEEELSPSSYLRKAEPASWKQYLAFRRTTTMDEAMQSRSGGVRIYGVNPDGTDMTEQQYNKVYKRVEPFNPIDLSE